MKKRKKKLAITLTVLLSFIVMFLTAEPGVLADWPYFADEFGVDDASGDKNSNIRVPVMICNTAEAISCIIFGIHYDKSILGLASVRLGELTSDWNTPTVNNDFDWGTAVVLVYNGNPIEASSTGSVAELEFNVTGEPGQISHMDFYDLNYLPPHCGDIYCGIQFSDTDYNLGTAHPQNGAFTVVIHTVPAASGITILLLLNALLGLGVFTFMKRQDCQR